MRSGLKGMCEEPVLYEGLPVRLPCGSQASQESLADEAALCPKAGTIPPTCVDQPGLGELPSTDSHPAIALAQTSFSLLLKSFIRKH
jgi:hypothetical protein